jgi:hypothetical protein
MRTEKLVAGFGDGISGPAALISSACSTFNDAQEKGDGKNRMVTYPVIFEGTSTPAFFLSHFFNADAQSWESARKLLEDQAAEIVKVYNRGLLFSLRSSEEVLETVDRVAARSAV